MVDRQGLEMLRPQGAPATGDAEPGPCARRGADRGFRARPSGARAEADRGPARPPRLGRAVISPNGVWKVLCPPRAQYAPKRLALVAGFRAPYEPPREPEPEPHVETQGPGELVGIDCFFVGHLHGTKGSVWQLTAIRHLLLLCLGRTCRLPGEGSPSQPQVSALVAAGRARSAGEGWQLERVLTDNGSEFRAARLREGFAKLGAQHTRIQRRAPADQRPRRAPTPHDPRGMLAPRLRALPAGPLRGPQRQLETDIDYYNTHRAHTGRITAGKIPAEVVYGARKMEPR